jgi:hypothetical protein
MGRRIPEGKKIYTLSTLLGKQPGKLKKDPRYGTMMASLEGTEKLLRLRFNRRCYTLLDRAIIRPENLDHFYRTYRLPKHPFFPLFLAIKKSYLQDLEEKRKAREKLAAETMASLPFLVREYGQAFTWWEQQFSRGKGCFGTIFSPGTVKKAREYRAYDHCDWCLSFLGCLNRIREKYGAPVLREGERLLYRFILELPPPPAQLSEGDIKKNYRRLSLACHPDRGGDPAVFSLLSEARRKVY